MQATNWCTFITGYESWCC